MKMVVGKTCSTPTPARFTAAPWCVVIVSLLFAIGRSNGASDTLTTPPDARCACPGDVLTYTCSVIGGGNTLWKGTAFTCSNSANEILLRHSQFGSGGTQGDCTGGALAARSLRVENGNCYVSRLDATVSTTFNGQSIRCEHNTNTGTRLIGESVLNVISASNHYPSPTNVELSEINNGQVSFTWDAICSSVEFIVDSDCGVCPPSTNTSTVTCAEFQLPTVSNSTMCSFGINGRVCGITSDLITTVVLRVPEVPVISIIPSYFNESGMLAQMELSLAPGNQSEVISNDISGPILNYIPVILSPDNLPYETNISAHSSDRPFTVDIPSKLCSSPTYIRVNVSAANRVGQGFPSDARTIGCVNNFVRVKFDSDSTITCTFIDEVDATEKYCRIDYGLLDEGLTYSAEGSSNENTVSLSLTNLVSGQYQYIVLAGSDVATVRVEGNFTKVSPKGNDGVVIIAIVVPVGVILLLLTTVVTVILVWCCRSKPSPTDPSETGQGYVPLKTKFKDPHKLLKLKEIIGRELQVYEVKQDFALADFIVTKCKRDTYRRGCAFYELTYKKEDVHDRKEIIVWDKTTGKFFTPTVTSETLKAEGLLGEGVTRPHYSDQYFVFIQSMGSGKRHLQAGTRVLLDNSDNEHVELTISKSSPDQEQQTQQHTEEGVSLLSPVPKNYFEMERIIKADITLKEFWKAHGLAKKKLNIFLELAQLQLRPNKIRDVLLLDKATGQLFTDPRALSKVKENKEAEIDSKWRVLVLGEYETKHLGLKTKWYKMTLKPGMWVAYENPNFVYGFKFCALEVKEDNVRMSDFITKEKGSFESGKAFYEFKESDVEDLLYCRKAMNIQKGVVEQLLENEDSSSPSITWIPEASIATFYGFLKNAPGMGISSSSSSDAVLFIHSTSQGARCLIKGTRVLYIVGVDNAKKATGDHKGENGEESEAVTEKPLQSTLSMATQPTVLGEGDTVSKV